MMMRAGLLVLGSLVSMVAGCAGEAETRATTAAAGALEVDSQPSVTIRADDGSGTPVLALVGSGVRLSSGVIAISDRAERAIRYFGPDGRLLRSVGRAGSGPEEFADVSWLEQCAPDSLFVWDAIQHRATVLDAAGRVVRRFRLPGRPAIARCSMSGTFALHMYPAALRRPDPSGKAPPLVSPLLLTDAEGDSIGTLGEVQIGENRPLGIVTKIALSRDRLFVGTSDSAYVDVYTLDGTRLRTMKVGEPPRAPTAADYERAVDLQVAGFLDRNDREAMKEMLLRIPRPERMPAYFGLHADPHGRLWVQTSAPADSVTTFNVFDAAGNALGAMRLPGRLRVLEVGPDHLLGTYEASDGVEHVAVYPVRWRG